MPFCKNCGSEIDGESKFCYRCGRPVSQLPEPQSGEDIPGPEKTMKRRAPGYMAVRPENLPEGFLLDDRYEVKKKLGQGGFGVVYLVHDGKMEVYKAVKLIPEAVVNDLEAMENLRREASTMLALNHPNIVRVFDFHNIGNIKYIDMEYIDGMTLTKKKLKASRRRLPENEVREYALQIAEGLHYAHSKNILHKDIKPQNIMLAEDSRIKIMDFGIAETVRTSMSRLAGASTSGTLVYMSPEQILGMEIGKESDIYSFGATLYELLSGHPPFYKGDITYQILHKDPEYLEMISTAINVILKKCLKKNYRERFRNFEDILYEVKGKPASYVSLHSNKLSKKRGKEIWDNIKKEKRVTSAMVISYISIATGRHESEASAVVDGFWDYVVRRKHYQTERALVIPHFGTFRITYEKSRQGRDPRTNKIIQTQPRKVLKFRSRCHHELELMKNRILIFEPKIQVQNHSSEWISQDIRKSKLSIKRQITLFIAREKRLELKIVHDLLWAMFDVLVMIFFEGRREISWTKRGVMKPANAWHGCDPRTNRIIKRKAGRHYTFRCYRSFESALR